MQFTTPDRLAWVTFMGKLEEDLRENKDLRLEIMKFTGHQ
jgi:hypothetical protein